MEKLIIERLSEENFEDFFKLIQLFAKYEKLTPPDESAKTRLRVDGLSNDPMYLAYLGMLEKRPISYMVLLNTYSSFLGSKTLYLEDVFVLEEFRGKGVGQKMFDFCTSMARQEEYGRLDWCVLDWNRPMIQFSQRNGAQELPWKLFRLDRDQIERYRKLE
ncbi:GNAT family N-acetyltransferase [Candidatus Woesearchaeota archaeon]|nr:GNAT family N-acetyltransferase [Candidatus Woesearchaeota archaeon]